MSTGVPSVGARVVVSVDGGFEASLGKQAASHSSCVLYKNRNLFKLVALLVLSTLIHNIFSDLISECNLRFAIL